MTFEEALEKWVTHKTGHANVSNATINFYEGSEGSDPDTDDSTEATFQISYDYVIATHRDTGENLSSWGHEYVESPRFAQFMAELVALAQS